MLCDNHLIITRIKGKKIYIFEGTHYFENIRLLLISRDSIHTLSSDDILAGNFTWSNSTILVEDVIKWKKDFEILMIDYYAGDIGSKNNKKYLHQCQPTYTVRVSPHRTLYLKFSSSYNTCLIYLHVIEKWPNFSFKSLSCPLWSQISLGRKMRNVRSFKEVRLQKLIKFRLLG